MCGFSCTRSTLCKGEPVIEEPVREIARGTAPSEWSQTMGLNRQDKAAVVEEVSGIVASTASMIIAEYRGLTVEAATQLRAEARKQGVQLRVLKNTLVRRAVKGTEYECLSDKFVGPLVYAFSADPVAPAKVLVEFAKKNDKLVVNISDSWMNDRIKPELTFMWGLERGDFVFQPKITYAPNPYLSFTLSGMMIHAKDEYSEFHAWKNNNFVNLGVKLEF